MDIRPRTLGEIVDDAWRLALADAPLLLMFNALFLVPTFIVLLLMLSQPAPIGITQCLLPALAALMLPLMGLASGACQELCRQRIAGKHVVVWNCLTTPLRRGLQHAAARAMLLCLSSPGPLLLMVSFLPDPSPVLRLVGFLFGSLLTVLLSLPVWAACTSLHAVLASGATRSGTVLSELRRDIAAAAGKAAVLVLSRLPLLFFLTLQLHLLTKVLFWVADNLCGFDTTLLEVQLALFENPVYTTTLIMLSWLLLAPFFEASNFLLYTDVRTRQEGLDLQYRVQRAFGGTSPQARMPAREVARSLTVAALFFFLGAMTRADQAQWNTIHAVRSEIETIHAEIEKSEPYPGGQRWQARLRTLHSKLSRLDGGDPRRFRWFESAIADFADRKKGDALRTLDELQRRMALLEDSLTSSHQPEAPAREMHSPEDIKSFLRGRERRQDERNPPRQHVEEERPEVRREADRANGRRQPAGQPHQPADAGHSPAVRSEGLSFLGWLLLGGLGLAVVVLAIVLYLTSPRSLRTPKAESVSGTETPTPEQDARQVLEQSPAALWQQADTLAGDGRFRDAVRVLHFAVLALLHRQRLIRYEPTRTNGEYVRQVRLSEQAPPELHPLFGQLTLRFETAWYGEGPCESGEYRACRALADEMQQVAARA